MTKEDIMKMAAESGVLAGYEGEPGNLVTFAFLVFHHAVNLYEPLHTQLLREAASRFTQTDTEAEVMGVPV